DSCACSQAELGRGDPRTGAPDAAVDQESPVVIQSPAAGWRRVEIVVGRLAVGFLRRVEPADDVGLRSETGEGRPLSPQVRAAEADSDLRVIVIGPEGAR